MIGTVDEASSAALVFPIALPAHVVVESIADASHGLVVRDSFFVEL